MEEIFKQNAGPIITVTVIAVLIYLMDRGILAALGLIMGS